MLHAYFCQPRNNLPVTFLLKKLYPLFWLLLSGTILLADFATGSPVTLAVLLFFPVSLAAWFSGMGWGLALAIIAPSVRLGFHYAWTSHVTLADAVINTVVQIVAFSAFAILIDQIARQRAEIRVLKGILPTCAWCKQIRGEDGEWSPIETYISERSEARFSHGICPECSKKHFGEVIP